MAFERGVWRRVNVVGLGDSTPAGRWIYLVASCGALMLQALHLWALCDAIVGRIVYWSMFDPTRVEADI